MVFTSFSFLGFLALSVLAFCLTPRRRRSRDILPSGKHFQSKRHATALPPRGYVLLGFSLVFYAFAGWKKLIFLLLTALFVWLCSRQMGPVYDNMNDTLSRLEDRQEKAAVQKRHRKRCRRLAAFGIVILLVLYSYCKYGAMLVEAISSLLVNLGKGGPLSAWEVIVPLGLSYYTLSLIGYLLDVYWRKQEHESNFALFLLCVCYFPQILQGPIPRYRLLRKEFLEDTSVTSQRLCRGTQLILWGYFKKLVIADRLNLFITGVLGSYQLYDGLAFWVTALFSTFQLYADFSGCMDIVQGISELFGITVEKNFDHPFTSRSVAEWWRRWHITLCQWMKDYVYFPLAVSPHLIKVSGKLKKRFGAKAGKNFVTIVTIGVVWLLTGLWHGASWTFVVWGLYHGILLLLEKYPLKGILAKTPSPIRHILTLLAVIVGWVLFFSPDFSSAIFYLGRMFGAGSRAFWDSTAKYYFAANWKLLVLGILGCGPWIRTLYRHLVFSRRSPGLVLSALLLIGIFLLCVPYMTNATYQSFLYAQF